MLFTRFFAMLAALLCLAQGALASDIMVTNAFARASLVPTATSGAVYLTIENHGTTDDRLLTITTPAASSAMIHETTMVDNVMKMRMVDGGLRIPAGAKVEMNTGGTHVMLMGLTAPLKQGGNVEVELLFEKAGKVALIIPVQAVAAQ